MLLLIGPCMFFAPLLIVLLPVALILWPPSLILVGLVWLMLWPFAAAARGNTASGAMKAQAKVGSWFRILLTPWTFFDAPKTAPPDATPPSDEPPSPAA